MNTTIIRKCLVPAALLGLMLTVSAAQANPPRSINARQAQQRERLRQGRSSGELTYAERLRLQAREAQTRRQEARYRKSGGKLTLTERLRLERELNRNSKAIYGNKHDRQDNDHRNSRWSRPN